MPMREKLFSNVRRNDENGCLEWIAGKTKAGYGQMHVPGSGKNAAPIYCHVLAYKLAHGDIPDGQFVLHRCDNRACVEPNHLFLGTHLDNIKDMLSKNRQAKGEGKPKSAKLREQDVREIFERFAAGETIYKIAKDKHVCWNTVSDVVRGVTWKHLSANRPSTNDRG